MSGYRVDVPGIARNVGALTVCGGVLGAVVGLARHNGSAMKGAFLGASQCGVFACSYYGVREGYRKWIGVQSWQQDWYAINTVSAATGAGIMTVARNLRYQGRAVAFSMIGGALVGMSGSLFYVFLERWRVAQGEDVAMAPGDSVKRSEEPWFELPSWSPIRRIDQEEAEQRKKGRI